MILRYLKLNFNKIKTIKRGEVMLRLKIQKKDVDKLVDLFYEVTLVKEEDGTIMALASFEEPQVEGTKMFSVFE